MTKFYTLMIALCFMVSCGLTEAAAQQTPLNTVCNEKSGLQWDMNSELDVDFYTVYVANNPNIAIANPPVNGLITIPHDPANATIDTNGNKVLTHTMDVTMAEGDKYFVVTVTDFSGNMSGYSNEAGCDYNTTPGAPQIKLIFTKAKP